MRVGEILLEHGWVNETALARALRDQQRTGDRLCSLLVARGQLDPDHAALALAEQHAVAAVLRRHLDNRDPELATLLSADVARACMALPIGRVSNGDLVVCVRDPSPQLARGLVEALDSPVVIAVTAACFVEELIDQTYGGVVEASVDIDMNTGPITIPSDLGALTLVELDDHRVAKDPTQTDPLIGRRSTVSTLPPLTKNSRR